jgi:hypothetical protein
MAILDEGGKRRPRIPLLASVTRAMSRDFRFRFLKRQPIADQHDRLDDDRNPRDDVGQRIFVPAAERQDERQFDQPACGATFADEPTSLDCRRAIGPWSDGPLCPADRLAVVRRIGEEPGGAGTIDAPLPDSSDQGPIVSTIAIGVVSPQHECLPALVDRGTCAGDRLTGVPHSTADSHVSARGAVRCLAGAGAGCG